MKVLVTGGAGYIGSHAVRHLLEQGFEVVVLDDLSQGHAEAVDTRARLVIGNTRNQELLLGLMTTEKIDAVMHFAAFIEVAESVREPERYYQNNFVNTLSLLHAMKGAGVGRIVFSSTAAVYGQPDVVPIPEEARTLPINPYGKSKLMVEWALQDYCSAYGLGYAILRYFNVAGAAPDFSIGEDHYPETHLIPRVLASARSREPVEIFGADYSTPDGTCIRDYVHVMDLVRAHRMALERLLPGDSFLFNIGSESGFSVREVIAACAEVTGIPIAVKERPRRPGDPAVLVASSRKIRNFLHWEREFPDLKSIVKHAWNWHSKNPKGFSREKSAQTA